MLLIIEQFLFYFYVFLYGALNRIIFPKWDKENQVKQKLIWVINISILFGIVLLSLINFVMISLIISEDTKLPEFDINNGIKGLLIAAMLVMYVLFLFLYFTREKGLRIFARINSRNQPCCIDEQVCKMLIALAMQPIIIVGLLFFVIFVETISENDRSMQIVCIVSLLNFVIISLMLGPQFLKNKILTVIAYKKGFYSMPPSKKIGKFNRLFLRGMSLKDYLISVVIAVVLIAMLCCLSLFNLFFICVVLILSSGFIYFYQKRKLDRKLTELIPKDKRKVASKMAYKVVAEEKLFLNLFKAYLIALFISLVHVLLLLCLFHGNHLINSAGYVLLFLWPLIILGIGLYIDEGILVPFDKRLEIAIDKEIGDLSLEKEK